MHCDCALRLRTVTVQWLCTATVHRDRGIASVTVMPIYPYLLRAIFRRRLDRTAALLRTDMYVAMFYGSNTLAHVEQMPNA